MEDFNKELKDWFSKQGITQEDIAKRLDVSQPYVNALLNGKGFGKKQAEKWNKLFGIPVTLLLTREGSIEKNGVVQYNQFGNNINDNSVQTNNVTTNDLSGTIMNEIVEQRKIMNKSQEQIDRLLSLLEKK